MAEQQISLKKKRRRTGFTQVPNDLLANDKLSGLAKALWCLLFSKPDDWVFYWSEILSNFKEGRDSVIKAKKELEKFKYITCKQTKRSMNGRMVFGGMEIELDDQPNLTTLENSDSLPSTEFQGTENQDTEIPSTEDEQSEAPSTENKSSYKDLPDPNLSNQKIPNQGEGFLKVYEGLGFEEKRIYDSLSKMTLKEVELIAPEKDIAWLLSFYAPWVKKKGWPKDINAAFPAWVKSFLKKKENQTPSSELASSFRFKKTEKASPDLMVNRIKSVLSPENWEKYFAGKRLEETEKGWKILVDDPTAFECEEVLNQINVKIELK